MIPATIAGIVAPNPALHGTLYGSSMADPDFTWNGASGVINGDGAADEKWTGTSYALRFTASMN